MLSDRCCINLGDQGWLAPQELLSCDTANSGCDGGQANLALDYIVSANGLVKEDCFPYAASNLACPQECHDNSNWAAAHVCDCNAYTTLSGSAEIMSAIANGPVTLGFFFCRSFLSYKDGIYQCDCLPPGDAILTARAIGYATQPFLHYVMYNSWGDHGTFKIRASHCGVSGSFPELNTACTSLVA